MNWKPVSELPPMPHTGIFARPENAFRLLVRWVCENGHEQFSIGGCQQMKDRVDFYSGDINGRPNADITHWSLITPPGDDGDDQIDSIDVCPCLIADSPCKPDCSCVHEYSSAGCRCCASCGSAEQRKHAANLIVQRMQKPNVEAALAEALQKIVQEGDYSAPEGMKQIARAALKLWKVPNAE